MDESFINKRIQEQREYMYEIQTSSLPEDRKMELIISANNQLWYFTHLKNNRMEKLKAGQLIYFTNEGLPYNVMATSNRYAVVSRKFDKKEDDDLLEHAVSMGGYLSKEIAYKDNKRFPVYSIIDFNENCRSTDNMVFGIFNYFDKNDCEKCIKSLEEGSVELSHRNKADLLIDWNKTNSQQS